MTPPASAASAPPVRRGADRKVAGRSPGRPPGRARLQAPPRAPRRVSGAARGAGPVPPARPAHDDAGAFALGLSGALASLSRHRLLDRLISGRAWIAFVAFALIGIVTMQLGLLKLNGGIGRALEHEALLQRENAALSIENSELTAAGPVQSRAARIGMELAPLRGLVFLAARPGADPTRAATALATFGQAAAGTSEAGGATAASAPSESASPGSASSESGSPGSASTGSVGESSATGPPAATSGPSEGAGRSSPEASARPAPGASTPSGAEAPAPSGPQGAAGGEAASGGATGGSPSGG